MSDRLFVRQLNGDDWEWRNLIAGQWQPMQRGARQQLLDDVPAHQNACLIVPGQHAVVRRVSVDNVEKKHMAKLLPYEMEDELADSVDDLHFCFGNVQGDMVNVVYQDHALLERQLQPLADGGVDIYKIFPDFLLLDIDGLAGVLVLENEQVLAKFGEGEGFAIEINIAAIVLQSLAADKHPEGSLRLFADSPKNIEILKSCLPEDWLESESLDVDEVIGDYWDALDVNTQDDRPDMRSGTFGRQLPFNRWWRNWKIPVYSAAAAFVLALGVTYGDYLSAKGEGLRIRKEMQAVYLQAVPNGRPGDEEQRLKSLLSGSGGKTSEPTNLTNLLAGLAGVLTKRDDIQLMNFRYNGEQFEMQVNIEVKGLGELGQFRDMLATAGLTTDSPRTSRQGNVYRATMKITETN